MALQQGNAAPVLGTSPSSDIFFVRVLSAGSFVILFLLVCFRNDECVGRGLIMSD